MNLYYIKKSYAAYSQVVINFPQVGGIYILFPDYSKVYEFVHNLNWVHLNSSFACKLHTPCFTLIEQALSVFFNVNYI